MDFFFFSSYKLEASPGRQAPELDVQKNKTVYVPI